MSQRAHEVTKIDARSKAKSPPVFWRTPHPNLYGGNLKGWFSTLETSFACIAEGVYATVWYQPHHILTSVRCPAVSRGCRKH